MGDLGIYSDLLVQIIIALVVLSVIWLVLRSLLRLTMRIFSIGCSLIVLIALFVLLYRLFF
jgi:hypothetical protein